MPPLAPQRAPILGVHDGLELVPGELNPRRRTFEERRESFRQRNHTLLEVRFPDAEASDLLGQMQALHRVVELLLTPNALDRVARQLRGDTRHPQFLRTGSRDEAPISRESSEHTASGVPYGLTPTGSQSVAEYEIAGVGEPIVGRDVFDDDRLVAVGSRSAGADVGTDLETVGRLQVSRRQAGAGGHEQPPPMLLVEEHDRAERLGRDALDRLRQGIQHFTQRRPASDELQHAALDLENHRGAGEILRRRRRFPGFAPCLQPTHRRHGGSHERQRCQDFDPHEIRPLADFPQLGSSVDSCGKHSLFNKGATLYAAARNAIPAGGARSVPECETGLGNGGSVVALPRNNRSAARGNGPGRAAVHGRFDAWLLYRPVYFARTAGSSNNSTKPPTSGSRTITSRVPVRMVTIPSETTAAPAALTFASHASRP